MFQQPKVGEVHDNLTSTTTELHNAIVTVNDEPSLQNKIELRKRLRRFQDLGGLLTHYAYDALNKKK